MTVEQGCVYDAIMVCVSTDKGGLFFLYGYNGTEKTFIWNTLAAAFGSIEEIVIDVVSNGILLLPGDRNAHFRFSVALTVNEDSTCCNIKQGSPELKILINQNKTNSMGRISSYSQTTSFLIDACICPISRFCISGICCKICKIQRSSRKEQF